MARLNDEGQWIVLMGFIVSVSIFFLAFIMSQSTLVGQTTSEAVLEFPKSEIQDLKSDVIDISIGNITHLLTSTDVSEIKQDVQALALYRQNAVVDFEIPYSPDYKVGDYYYYEMTVHFNNGITEYDETYSIIRPIP
jgi:hypothetical protein